MGLLRPPDDEQRAEEVLRVQSPKGARGIAEILEKVRALQGELKHGAAEASRQEQIRAQIQALKWVLREGEL